MGAGGMVGISGRNIEAWRFGGLTAERRETARSRVSKMNGYEKMSRAWRWTDVKR